MHCTGPMSIILYLRLVFGCVLKNQRSSSPYGPDGSQKGNSIVSDGTFGQLSLIST